MTTTALLGDRTKPGPPNTDFRGRMNRMDFKSYVSFHGRLARGSFFAYYGLPFLVLGGLPGLLLPHGPTQVSLEYAVLLLVLPGIAKRIHDANYSLWVLAIVEAVYAGALAIQTTGVFGERRTLVMLLANIPFLGLMLALYVKRGTTGPNRFGEDPLGSETPVLEPGRETLGPESDGKVG